MGWRVFFGKEKKKKSIFITLGSLEYSETRLFFLDAQKKKNYSELRENWFNIINYPIRRDGRGENRFIFLFLPRQTE